MLQIFATVVGLCAAALNAAAVMSGHGNWFNMIVLMVLCFICGGNSKILLDRWLERG
jgi:hypothetical protein